jgi:hypothetical protein
MTPAQRAQFEKGPCPLCGRPKTDVSAYMRESRHSCAKAYHEAVSRLAMKER